MAHASPVRSSGATATREPDGTGSANANFQSVSQTQSQRRGISVWPRSHPQGISVATSDMWLNVAACGAPPPRLPACSSSIRSDPATQTQIQMTSGMLAYVQDERRTSVGCHRMETNAYVQTNAILVAPTHETAQHEYRLVQTPVGPQYYRVIKANDLPQHDVSERSGSSTENPYDRAAREHDMTDSQPAETQLDFSQATEPGHAARHDTINVPVPNTTTVSEIAVPPRNAPVPRMLAGGKTQSE